MFQAQVRSSSGYREVLLRLRAREARPSLQLCTWGFPKSRQAESEAGDYKIGRIILAVNNPAQKTCGGLRANRVEAIRMGMGDLSHWAPGAGLSTLQSPLASNLKSTSFPARSLGGSGSVLATQCKYLCSVLRT